MSGLLLHIVLIGLPTVVYESMGFPIFSLLEFFQTFGSLQSSCTQLFLTYNHTNLPAMRETWVRSLGWEDSLEKGKATHYSILAWRILWIV